ncbi:MAG: glycosyltransferase, partial [Oricola sp.]
MPVQGSDSARLRPGAALAHRPATARFDRARELARAVTEIPQATAANENRLCRSVAFLAAHAFPRLFLSRATQQAVRNGTSGASEMLAHGLISEEAYYRALAEDSGAAFIEPETIVAAMSGETEDGDRIIARKTSWCRLNDGTVRALYAPAPDHPDIGTDRFRASLKRGPAVAITTPSGLRAALSRQVRRPLGNDACDRLATERPRFSAKHGAGAWHGFLAAAASTGFIAGIVTVPSLALLALHSAVTMFFLATVTLRLAAAITYRRTPLTPLMRFSNCERPVYSVVVALHREAPVVADLIGSLKALRWPRSKLEIKLVCEEGDRETRTALAGQKFDRRFEIVTVPLTGPQTKPKALNYALPFCSGRFVTLYDAEDRPHPDQLEEAWQTFRRSDAKIGAL